MGVFENSFFSGFAIPLHVIFDEWRGPLIFDESQAPCQKRQGFRCLDTVFWTIPNIFIISAFNQSFLNRNERKIHQLLELD